MKKIIDFFDLLSGTVNNKDSDDNVTVDEVLRRK